MTAPVCPVCATPARLGRDICAICTSRIPPAPKKKRVRSVLSRGEWLRAYWLAREVA